jgi:hypothetical protein
MIAFFLSEIIVLLLVFSSICQKLVVIPNPLNSPSIVLPLPSPKNPIAIVYLLHPLIALDTFMPLPPEVIRASKTLLY